VRFTRFGSRRGHSFLFVPLTLGLSVLIAIMETIYVKKGDEEYKRMAKFWGKLFLINLAVSGVCACLPSLSFSFAPEMVSHRMTMRSRPESVRRGELGA
jgi:cytochrome bd-type quinol oxidase subunit 1